MWLLSASKQMFINMDAHNILLLAEFDAWWLVDLLAEENVYKVVIYPRPDANPGNWLLCITESHALEPVWNNSWGFIC